MENIPMAKKQTAKKPNKSAKSKPSPARAGAAKAARKPAKAAKPAKSAPKAASAKMPKGIVPVSTGKGPSAADVGRDFVALFNARTPDQEIWNKLFAKEFTSVEGHGANVAFHGRAAVTAKCDQWLSSNTIHGCSCEGPYAGSTCFAVKIRIDKTDNSTGRREVMEEVAIYTVQDGKVVREEFCYAM
jgi:hypothetical protein